MSRENGAGPNNPHAPNWPEGTTIETEEVVRHITRITLDVGNGHQLRAALTTTADGELEAAFLGETTRDGTVGIGPIPGAAFRKLMDTLGRVLEPPTVEEPLEEEDEVPFDL